jgi:hypothetical protein
VAEENRREILLAYRAAALLVQKLRMKKPGSAIASGPGASLLGTTA